MEYDPKQDKGCRRSGTSQRSGKMIVEGKMKVLITWNLHAEVQRSTFNPKAGAITIGPKI